MHGRENRRGEIKKVMAPVSLLAVLAAGRKSSKAGARRKKRERERERERETEKESKKERKRKDV